MVKFSEDLWDGFDATNSKTEVGVQSVKDIAEFLKKRAEIEAHYAKSLAALCKTVPGASGGGLFGGGSSKGGAPIEKENKTLKAALISLQEEGNKAATAHLEFANKIINDVVKPLDTFIKTKEPERKKLALEGQKRIKALSDAKVGAEKAKEVYQRATKEADAAIEAHEKAKNDLSSAAEKDQKRLAEAEKRAGQKVGPLTEKAKASEVAYGKAVDVANETITKTYSEHLPPIIESFQQFEEERYKQLHTVLTEFVTIQRTIPTNLDERVQEIDKNVSSVDVEADLSEYVESHKSASKEPELVKNIATKDQELSKPAESEKEKEKEKEGEKEGEKEVEDLTKKQEDELF